MDRNNSWIRRMADRSGLDEEVLPTMPLVEIAGDNRVLIEGHKGVTEYSREKICVKVRYGHVSVCGCGLELSRMSREHLVITGRIDCVQFGRRR